MPKTKKSAAGSGNIRKRTRTVKGKQYTFWEGRITVGYDPKTGRQIQKYVSGKTQKEVSQKLRELATALDQGTYIEPTKMTVGGWLDIWLGEYLGSLKMRTADSYRTTVEVHLKPAFGRMKLETLTTTDIQRFYNALQRQEKPLSPKSIHNIHGVLHKALQQAVELGYLHKNPSDPCKLPRVEKAPIQPLDDEAIKSLLKTIQGHRYEYIYLVTLFTGMREGEVLGLKWDSVDFDEGTILICQQIQRKRGGNNEYVFCSPKNGKSRKIAPAPFVMDILQAQKQRQDRWRQDARELWEDSGLVFTDEVGHNLSPLSVYKNFKKMAGTAGYPEARFHDLRHSFAVASLQNGDDIKTVQENLGHHTAAFTLDVYGHVTEKMRRDSANRMQQFITSVREDEPKE